MAKSFNCPNCGAPIDGDLCPYCGTVFIDWSTIDIRKSNWIKIKLNDKIVLVKAVLLAASAHVDNPEPISYVDRFGDYCIQTNPNITIESTFNCIPFNMPDSTDEVLFVTIDKNTADLQEAGEMVHEIMTKGQTNEFSI